MLNVKNLPKSFPLEFIEIMMTWGAVHKSPYGHSYYDQQVGWGFKPDLSYRISDHWNFTSKGKVHCQTVEVCKNNTCWTIARYCAELGKYIVIKSIPKTISLSSIDRMLVQLEIKRNRAVKNILENGTSSYIIQNRMKDLELNILNSYFKVLEKL